MYWQSNMSQHLADPNNICETNEKQTKIEKEKEITIEKKQKDGKRKKSHH